LNKQRNQTLCYLGSWYFLWYW